MNKKILIIILISLLIIISACFPLFKTNNINKNEFDVNNLDTNGDDNVINLNENIKINIIVNNQTFNATLENNETTKEFVKLFPMIVTMNEHNSNEKYYDLQNRLPTNSNVPSRINVGDLLLYGSNTVVLFYESFSTSYSYTRLGSIDNTNGLKSALGKGNVTVVFKITE